MGRTDHVVLDRAALKSLFSEDASSSLVRLIFERAPAAMAIVDRDMRYLAVSDRWYKDYELGDQKILGRSHYDVFPDVPERWREEHRRCLAGEHRLCEQDQFIRDDGRSVWIRWEIVPVIGEGAVVEGMIMLTEVVTKHIEAENARKAGELAQQVAHVGSWDGDIATDQISCSAEMCRVLGLDPVRRSFRMDDLLEFVHPLDREFVLGRVGAVRAGEMPHPELETRALTAAGALIWVRMVIRTSQREAGRALMVHGVIQEVTEQKLAQRELAFRDRAIDTAASPLTIATLDGHYTYANMAFVELLGLDSAEQVLGLGAIDFVVDRGMVSGSIAALGDTGRWTGELVFRRADGGEVDVSVYAALVFDDDGAPHRIVVSYSDITDRNKVMQALARRERQLRQAQELARLGPWRFDLSTRLYHAPPETRQVLGLPDDYATYGMDHATRSVHPDDLARVEAVARQVIDGTLDMAEVQYRYLSLGRELTHVRVIMSAERDDSGRAVALTGLIQDVTPSKELEAAHRETERAMSALMRNLSGVVYRCDNEQRWTMRFVSDACARLMGYEAHELIGNSVISYNDVIDPRDRQRVWDGIQDAVDNRRAFQLSYRIIRKDGDLRWVLEQGSAIRDQNDAVVAIEGYIADITEEQRVVERLQQSEARNRAIMESASVAIITMDEYGVIESFNPEAERLFGYLADEATGRNLSLLMPAGYAEDHDALMARLRDEAAGRGAVAGPRELTAVRKNGEFFPVDLAISEMRMGDRRIFIGSLRDLTERKKAEARLNQAQKMETVGQLVGGVAHDFNNLLMAMQLNLELANMLATDRPDVSESITVALNAVDRGAELTRRLLAFSRQQPLDPKVIRVNELVRNMMRLLHRLLEEDIDTHTVLDADLHPVEVDPAQLEAALVNLVVNARDAMPDGGKLTIQTANLEIDGVLASQFEDMTPGHYTVVAVSDTGTGMPPEVQARAFDPFFTTKEVGKGSGLGLSMVYGFAKQSGGHVRIYSEPGDGTTVKLFFPRSYATPAATAPRPAPVVIRPGSETILLVEDDADVRLTVERLLKSLGYTVIAAPDGPSALALVDEGLRPDLLLADVVLPKGMSGRDVSIAVAERAPECRILFMSGYTEDAVMHHGRLDEGVVLLSKPFPRELLASKVRELLDA